MDAVRYTCLYSNFGHLLVNGFQTISCRLEERA